MRQSRSLPTLVTLTGLLSGVAALAGLLWNPGSDSIESTMTVRGESVALSGTGLYRYDSALIGAGFRGVDVVVLLICIPMLLLALRASQRGSLRGTFVLAGCLSFLCYNYASMALGASYNEFFLVYTAIFSLSLFSIPLTVARLPVEFLSVLVRPSLPLRSTVAYLATASSLLFVVWLSDVAVAGIRGVAPATLAHYSTVVTYVIDLGLVAPFLAVAAWHLHHRTPRGYLLAGVTLTFNLSMGVALMAQSAAILMAGISMSVGQLTGMVLSFALLSIVGFLLAYRFLTSFKSEVPAFGPITEHSVQTLWRTKRVQVAVDDSVPGLDSAAPPSGIVGRS